MRLACVPNPQPLPPLFACKIPIPPVHKRGSIREKELAVNGGCDEGAVSGEECVDMRWTRTNRKQ